MSHVKTAIVSWLGLTLCGVASASVVTYMDTETLVRLSPVIVHGTVTSVRSVLTGDDALPVTDVTLSPLELLRGSMSEEDSTVTIRMPGGRVDGRAARVYGTPTFREGEQVVLFARPAKNGWLTVTGLFQGKIVVETVDGESFAVRAMPSDYEQLLVVDTGPGGGDGGSGEDREPARRPLDDFLADVRTLASTTPAIDRYSPEPEAEAAATRERESFSAADPEDFTFLLIPFRRFEPDSGNPIIYRYNPENAPGTRDAFENALVAWTSATGHDAELLDGGDTTAECYLTFDGISGVSHDDPCGEVPAFDDQTCSGVLAIGGMSEINPFVFTTTNGQLFLQGLQGDVVLNSDAECFFSRPGNYEEVLSHEIGHTLGLGHSCGDPSSPDCTTSDELDQAQMRAVAHGDGRGASLGRDDVKGIRFIYPPDAFVELRANDAVFGPGDLLAVDMDLNGTSHADIWFFVILPGGGVTGGLQQANVPLSFLADLALIQQPLSASTPGGRYYILAILGRPGSDLTAEGDIFSFSFVSFDFVP